MATRNLETKGRILSIPMAMMSMKKKAINFDYFLSALFHFVVGIEITTLPHPYSQPHPPTTTSCLLMYRILLFWHHNFNRTPLSQATKNNAGDLKQGEPYLENTRAHKSKGGWEMRIYEWAGVKARCGSGN